MIPADPTGKIAQSMSGRQWLKIAGACAASGFAFALSASPDDSDLWRNGVTAGIVAGYGAGLCCGVVAMVKLIRAGDGKPLWLALVLVTILGFTVYTAGASWLLHPGA